MSKAALSSSRQTAIQSALDEFQSTKASWKLVYSSRPEWPGVPETGHPTVGAVLDSSFNPPTLAHDALMELTPEATKPWDAILLVYSVRNADKGHGRPGDASPLQRLQMMELFAYHLEVKVPNVAVVLVDEPLFFAKADLVRQHVPMSMRLDWLMGSDTITRVFDLKYYDSEAAFQELCHSFFDKHRCRIVCAERNMSAAAPAAKPAGSVSESLDDAREMLRKHPAALHWYECDAIDLRALDLATASRSSTAVRRYLFDAHHRGISCAEMDEELQGMVPSTLVPYLLSENLYNQRP